MNTTTQKQHRRALIARAAYHVPRLIARMH